jgi:hypothetical protein
MTLMAGGLVVPAGAAWANDVPGQCPQSQCPPEELPNNEVVEVGGTAGPATEVAGEAEVASGLPVTGADIVGLTAIGAGAVLAGSVLVNRSRAKARK